MTTFWTIFWFFVIFILLGGLVWYVMTGLSDDDPDDFD